MRLTNLSALLVLITTLLPASLFPQGMPQEPETLTVMSYNIHHGRGMDDVVDLERIAEVILGEGADIVGLQEVDVGVRRSHNLDIASELARLTGLEYVVFGKNLDHDGGEYGIAVLSKYPVTSYENMQFKKMGNEQRSIQAMQINLDGFPILLMNTHLAHRREDEAERLHFIEAARDVIIPAYPSARAVLFTGDFNDVPGSATHLALKKYLKDVWELAGAGGEGLTIPPDEPSRRIDYIFFDGDIQPVEARVPRTQASDHLPVVATFRLNR